MSSGFRFSLLALAAGTTLAVQSCAPSQEAPSPASSQNFSRYVAVGDSYTAGVSNGGLTRSSQQYAYPNLLAETFRRVSAEVPFTQPYFEAGAGTNYLTLVSYDGSTMPVLRRVPGTAVRGTVINPSACGGPDTLRLYTRSSTATTPPQNLGVPGLRLSQIEVVGLGDETRATPGAVFNPFFERLLPAGSSSTYLQAVAGTASGTTFFTYFQAFDDFMPYVLSGGDCTALLPTGTTLRNNAVKILTVLREGNRPGIIARMPSITLLPLLQLGRGIDLQTRLRNSLHNDTLEIYFQSTITQAAEPISNDDYVLATAISRIGTPVSVGGVSVPYGLSPLAPLRTSDVLENTEVRRISLAVSTYNNALEVLARDTYKMPSLNGTYTLDLDAVLFYQVASKVAINGVQYTTEPVRGNFFSLDYYSLTPRGNGLLANAFIQAINAGYRSTLPYVDVNSLPTTSAN